MNRSTTPTDREDDDAPPLAPALASDMARMFRLLGVESFRATVVDIGSMAFQAAWVITDNGEVSDDHRDRPLDSQFPGAMGIVAQLAQSPAETTVVQRLSPRRWTFAWRINSTHVVIAEARYRDMRAAISHTDTALVRLVCDTGIRAGQTGARRAGPAAAGRGALVWPAERDRRRRPRSPLAKRLAPGLAIAAAALSLWLALVALPEAHEATQAAQSAAARLRSAAEQSLLRRLAAALATADTGELQTELTQFEQLGAFQGAVVLGPAGRIVALAGAVDGLRAGAELPAELARASRVLDLALGSERYGRLALLRPPGPLPEDRFGTIRIAALAVFASAAAAAALLLWRQRRARRIGD